MRRRPLEPGGGLGCKYQAVLDARPLRRSRSGGRRIHAHNAGQRQGHALFPQELGSPMASRWPRYGLVDSDQSVGIRDARARNPAQKISNRYPSDGEAMHEMSK